MNERIRALALEAGAQGIVNRDFIDIEKFAQLLVRECADIATINQHEWHSAGSYVLKHFGFEQ
jgi:hypothetical protein